MMARLALVLLCCLLAWPVGLVRADEPHQWFLNGNGTTGKYQIFAFGDDGRPDSVLPVVPATGALLHVAWPSAIQVGNERWLLASGYDGSRWGSLYRWVSTDGGPWVARGPWFSANAAEPYGIGPAHVLIDPGAADPFIVVYLVRGPSGPGNIIAVATSPDGVTWTRRGPILGKTLPQETGGLAMSYACRQQSGEWAVFYSGYSADLTRAAALVATGPSLLAPLTDKSVMLEGNSQQTTLTANPAETTATVGAVVQTGMPYLIVDGAYTEVIVPVAQEGNRLWLDRPLFYRHTNAVLTSMAARKIDPSYAQQQPDGAWRGIMTVYGPQAGVFAEYTTEASAPDIDGPWTWDNTGLRFSPWLNGTLYSAENPTPLTHDASCAA